MDSIENTTKKLITSLLTSTPLAVTMLQLSKDYTNTIGEPIPYQKLGYNSLEHFLRSIDDTVQVKGSGPTAEVIPVFSERSAHVNKLVTNQKISKPKNKRNFQFRRITYYPSRNSHNNVGPPQTRIHYPSAKDASNMSIYSSQSSDSRENVNYSAGPQVDTKKVHVTSPSLKSPTTPMTPLNGSVKSNRVDNSEDTKNTNTSRSEYRPKLEYKNKLSEETAAKRSSNVKNTLKSLTPDKTKALNEQENKVPYYIRNNLRCLISQFPKGLWCAELPEKYRKMFGQPLKYQEIGFNNLIDLCVYLSSIFHYVRPSMEDFKLYDRSLPLPDCAEKTFTVASYSNQKGFSNLDSNCALPRIEWADVNRYLPEDILKPGSEIPRAFLPSDVKENDTIDLAVGEIYDLSKFWIYLQDSLLDKLMDDIQSFYKDHACKYEIPSHLLREGLYCVQVIFGEYHRALIVDTMPDIEDMIRVIFIDYGTMTKVSMKGLCFLHTKFSTLPAQAIRCSLANIVPVEKGIPWSREASKTFRNMVADRDTSAKISHINREEQVLEIYLADVTDENNIFYINDKLVEEGYATYPDKERQQSPADPIYTPIVKLIHLFPTFLELEHGLAPSTCEMEVFHDCNIPINFCYPQYFHVDHSCEEEIIKIAEDFHEKNCVKTKRRLPTRFYDTEKLRVLPLDFAVFGELEPDIKAFMAGSPKEEGAAHNSDEDFIDAEEETPTVDRSRPDDLVLMEEQFKKLTTKEDGTANMLKTDLQVTEDIMKDINFTWDSYEDGEVSNDYLRDNMCYGLDNGWIQSEYAKFTDLYTLDNGRELWAIDETRESGDIPNFTSMLGDRDDSEIFFDHPLSKMSFDKNDSEDGEQSSSNSSKLERCPIYELCEPDLKLDVVDFSSGDAAKLPSSDTFLSQISDVLKADLLQRSEKVSDKDSNAERESEADSCGNVSTNPFLNGLNDNAGATEELTIDTLTLNPDNPFLTFLDRSCSSSSASSQYNSPVVQSKVVNPWSHFDDISMETISALGKTLSSKSPSIISAEDNLNCSVATQTLCGENYPPHPQLYPPPTAYSYAQWSLDYGRPYHMQFSNHLGYYEPGPAYRPPAPAYRPPAPAYRPPAPLCFTPMAYRGAAPQRTSTWCPTGTFNPSNPYAQPYGGPSSQFTRTTDTAAAPVSVDRDFYDIYNERMVRRPDGSSI